MDSSGDKTTQRQFILPARLRQGDQVAIIAPSSGAASRFPVVYALALKRLRDVFKLEPVEYPTARSSSAYLAKNPRARAEDIHHAFLDPAIKAVIATIGGNDQVSVLKYLDPEILKSHPKIFLGFSDNANLHLYLWNLGIISYYGASLLTQFAMPGSMHEYTVRYLKRALFEDSFGEIEPSDQWTDFDFDWADASLLDKVKPLKPNTGWFWHQADGKHVSGRLWGGCFEILSSHLRLHRYMPAPADLKNAVLFVETSEELPGPGEVERFFRDLGEAGLLSGFSAVLLGRPKTQSGGVEPGGGSEKYSQEQREVICQVISEYAPELPTVFNLDFGHTDPQIPIPSGAFAEIDGDTRTIAFSYLQDNF